jgi:hypothetical protein
MTAAASLASHGQCMARSFSTGKYALAMLANRDPGGHERPSAVKIPGQVA